MICSIQTAARGYRRLLFSTRTVPLLLPYLFGNNMCSRHTVVAMIRQLQYGSQRTTKMVFRAIKLTS
ncbi:uncharacterized protein YALI1_E16194g [Yarrowia lipolytica]|uniref:Uncharacterized protein n=1 Tax=Yarrowia lipolytica TaxID=4952 RepID=A0A1D8NI93_YARLL|nr:hypothetical protein YALI1_E16194g [Yarrowia lipolytica]